MIGGPEEQKYKWNKSFDGIKLDLEHYGGRTRGPIDTRGPMEQNEPWYQDNSLNNL